MTKSYEVLRSTKYEVLTRCHTLLTCATETTLIRNLIGQRRPPPRADHFSAWYTRLSLLNSWRDPIFTHNPVIPEFSMTYPDPPSNKSHLSPSGSMLRNLQTAGSFFFRPDSISLSLSAALALFSLLSSEEKSFSVSMPRRSHSRRAIVPDHERRCHPHEFHSFMFSFAWFKTNVMRSKTLTFKTGLEEKWAL